jgi:hypothetical protein
MYGTAFASNQQKNNPWKLFQEMLVGSVSSNQIFVIENGTAKLKQ